MKKALLFILIQILTFNLYSQCGSGEVVTLDGQSKVNSFLDDYCEDYLGVLVIKDDNDGQDDIVSLTPLLSLRTVGAPLLISGNNSLVSLTGLDSLTSVGSLSVSSNPLIKNLNGLNKLNSTIGDIMISFNDSLLHLDALSALTTVGSYGGVLTITRNPFLTDLLGLSSLTSLIGGIRVKENKILTTLEGLHNLKIYVDPDNDPLVEHIIITDNELLTDCSIQPVCEALSTDGVTFVIENNSGGCNSSMEILLNCDFSATHFIEQSIFNVFPNPFVNVINIESKKFTHLMVVNSIGQIVLRIKIAEGANALDLSNLDKGLYTLFVPGEYYTRVVKL